MKTRRMIVSTHRNGLAAGSSTAGSGTCHHFPPCPAATAPDRHAARALTRAMSWQTTCEEAIHMQLINLDEPGAVEVSTPPAVTVHRARTAWATASRDTELARWQELYDLAVPRS
jgi:hypothetical protein